MEKISNEKLLQTLDWAYETSINGAGILPSSHDLAQEYLNQNQGDPLLAAKSLVRWQTAKAATSGFLTGLGGIVTMPITIPASVASYLYIQLRMISSIAILAGFDPKSDKVKTIAYICLAGTGTADVLLKNAGIKIGEKLTNEAIKRIGVETIKKINSAVGFRLMTKFGTTGIVNASKLIPIVGGIIGGTFDATTTKTVGEFTLNLFFKNQNQGN
ncbi:EcsC family protein [Leptospira levettii]|uniref:EcsC family protein n=1 Tax=Leptospira levettii TaxID=2023178 RepID=UPI001083C0B2|nr:EcsC family protein [Leptospira levettii]TGL06737.1 EcsC family protein [Leptospira levettii]